MASASPVTDHDEIREWVESRGGRPACVKGTAALLRVDFGEPARSTVVASVTSVDASQTRRARSAGTKVPAPLLWSYAPETTRPPEPRAHEAWRVATEQSLVESRRGTAAYAPQKRDPRRGAVFSPLHIKKKKKK